MGRVAAIILKDGAIALIERRRGGELYYLFPGGSVEAGESNEDGLVREVREELGLAIVVKKLLAEVSFRGSSQRYYRAEIVGGEFGTGYGSEISLDATAESGSYTPVWLPIDDLLDKPVYPRGVAELVIKAARQGWPSAPVQIIDPGRPRTS